ncbi:hypothetical protein SAMN04488090_0618 [Siphonobacter aquaeclarae]|uniref:Uncharacterized protein n=1 Tax=Siphonobacter aquaeclarae TaxID=563176 RepID=A0A1G9ITX5_9BACT|nr:hypothetical protein SAMN04488090_0618 [Siphonobacter aquaeclarae]
MKDQCHSLRNCFDRTFNASLSKYESGHSRYHCFPENYHSISGPGQNFVS